MCERYGVGSSFCWIGRSLSTDSCQVLSVTVSWVGMVDTCFVQQMEAETPGTGGRANQTQSSSLAKPQGRRVDLQGLGGGRRCAEGQESGDMTLAKGGK